jgi:8-oxo-dGTP pyrophosphatase MutT (NUDIX family)
MLYLQEPEGFKPKFESVGCFVEHGGEILLLHRQDARPQGNTWGIPSGKIDDGEKPLEAMAREIREETGFSVPPSQIAYFSIAYVRFADFDFVYHIFHTLLDARQKVQLNHREHKDFRWISPSRASELPQIQDLDSCIKLFYKV